MTYKHIATATATTAVLVLCAALLAACSEEEPLPVPTSEAVAGQPETAPLPVPSPRPAPRPPTTRMVEEGVMEFFMDTCNAVHGDDREGWKNCVLAEMVDYCAGAAVVDCLAKLNRALDRILAKLRG